MAEKAGEIAAMVTAKEGALLKIIRSTGFGEVVIHVADGQPVRVEEVKKSIKL